MLLVHDSKPPFLDGRTVFTTQSEPVLPLKDATSDMAVVARKGSKIVMEMREKRDEAATRQRFWDMTDSKMGKITGVTDEERAQAAAHKEEQAKVNAKFGGVVEAEDGGAAGSDEEVEKDGTFAGHMKKSEAQSAFAKSKTLAEQRLSLPEFKA